MAQIKGLEGMTSDQINRELERGGRFVMYQYCISIIIMSFRRNSSIYFIRGGESGVGKSLGFSLLTFLLGWWGIPWGPIYTIGSLVNNFKGGKNVTQEVIASINSTAEAA